ncbi:unnamed protein product [Thelazia callipaeda]|uniref:50S ribosomal protein L5 n=1 Tax=Thelazia callipaeda TaxID=103827 RepID=A0A0N5CMP5_THECL|nr:unnamed protein product [Thelazia callipaeda]
MRRPYVENKQLDRPQALAGPVATMVVQLPRRKVVAV